MSGLGSLHKILKDETRQKIILLLNEKGSLSYTDLQDNLKVVSTGLLNYHLKVLGNLLEKNENAHYMLSEKGKLAYKLLTEFPTENSLSKKPKWWKKYWATIFIATIFIGLALPITQHIPVQNALFYLSLALIAEGIAYSGRVKPSIRLNRAMYILAGMPIGFVLWFLFVVSIQRTIYHSAANDLFFNVGSVLIFFVIGALIGDFIGRLRHYKGPEQYSP